MRKLLVCSLLLALYGCAEQDHGDIKEWMVEQSKGMKGRVQEPPPLIAPAIVSYSAKGLDSPFSSDKIRAKEGGLQDKNNPAFGRAPEYLENFPLESLRLIGIINYNDKMFALIQTPEKPKHVTIGNYMGSNFGEITAITKTEVRITERIKDSNDQWMKRDKVLYLMQAEGDKK